MGRKSISVRALGLGLVIWAGLGMLSSSRSVSVAKAAPEPAARPVSPTAKLEPVLRVIAGGRYGGRGSELIPLVTTTVQLRSTEVRLTQIAEPDSWQISASYELYNPARAATTLSLLFPEELCEPGAGRDCMPMRGAFLQPAVHFAGQALESTLSPVEAVRAFSALPGKGYVYQLTVPPRKPQRVSHEYRLERSGGSEWWGIHQLSAAGAYAGPVTQVRYIVELLAPVRYVVFPRAFTLRGFVEEASKSGRGSTTRLTFTADKLDERTDFLLALPGAALNGQSHAGYCVGYRGDKSAAELTEALRGYDLARLRVCREHLLSLHGYPFKDAATRARYYRNSPRLPEWADEQLYTIAAHPEDPQFSDALLSPGEQAYLKALIDADKK